LISLALATGLRAIELSLLDVGDLVSERRKGRVEWWLSLPDEKTKGQRGGRTLPLAPELIATLFAYIRSTGRAWENPEHRTTPLYLALNAGRPPRDEGASQAVMHVAGAPERRYRRLRPEQIRGVIHRVEEQWRELRLAEADGEAPEIAGDIRHLSPHALRHSAAIALLLGDEASERPPASVEHVRGWLGHFDIRTTQRYLAHIESREQRRRFTIRPRSRQSGYEPAAEPSDTPSQPPLFTGE
jgi:integrase